MEKGKEFQKFILLLENYNRLLGALWSKKVRRNIQKNTIFYAKLRKNNYYDYTGAQLSTQKQKSIREFTPFEKIIESKCKELNTDILMNAKSCCYIATFNNNNNNFVYIGETKLSALNRWTGRGTTAHIDEAGRIFKNVSLPKSNVNTFYAYHPHHNQKTEWFIFVVECGLSSTKKRQTELISEYKKLQKEHGFYLINILETKSSRNAKLKEIIKEYQQMYINYVDMPD